MANKINIVITAQDKASEPIKGASKNVDLFGKAMSVAGKTALTLGIAGYGAITTGATLAAKASFDQVKAVEEARYGLLAYEKDGQKVNRVLGDLVSYAKSDMGVLFNRADLFAAASTLKMYGNETDTLTDRVKILSKGVAMGKTSFQELSAIVGRAAAKGRLDAVDFDMLIERGIGIDRKFRGAKVSAEGLYKALNTALPDEILSGRANTIEGRMVRMKTAFRSVGDAILGVDRTTNNFIKGGLGDRLLQGIDDQTKFLKQLAPIVGQVTTAVLDFSDGAVAKATLAVGWLNKELAKAPGLVREVRDWYKERFDAAVRVAGGAVDWFKDRLDDGGKKLDEFKGWLEKNETALRVTATVLGVVFGPALIRAATLATISGAKIAISGLAAGGGWVAGAAKATGAWLVASARWVVMSAISSVKMVGHAVAVSVAHSIHAAKATVIWSVQFGKMLVVSSVSSVKMALHAADVGWAWVFNAARVSIAWVTTELPKVVAASATTALASSRHAVAVSAAWVLSAVRTSAVWVFTELPKIVAGFLATSGAAGTHSLLTSAAWIGSAVRSGAAWVVVELPRIIGAFVAMSGAAIVNAAIATGAWVSSAVTTTASFTALKALVATPLVMPAIAVAAAIASLVAVKRAADEARSAVDNAARVKEAAQKEDIRMIGIVKGQYQRGEISKAQYDKMLGIIGKNAAGTNYWQGGPSLINEHGPEVVNLPRGAEVVPAYRSREMTQNQGGGGHTVIIENYNSYNERDDNRFFRDLGFSLELAS